uniref:THAP-type domain-containing protein n=1 Tax=Clytia hemisphaerica TaxID=252671 RepID=A0A7M5VH38_9CNID
MSKSIIRNDTNNNGMKNECCIPGCKHKEGIHRSISFYNFPDQVSDFIAYRCWLREVRKFKSDCGETFDPVEDVLICENHFRNEDFSIDLKTGRKHLKHGSVPCLLSNYSSNESDVEVVNVDQEAETRNFDRIEYNRDEIKPVIKKAGQSKNFEHYRLLQEKEEQEEKLRRLLAQQEEHRGRFANAKQTQNKVEYHKEELNKLRRAKQLLELEEKQRQLTEAQAKMKERKNKNESPQGNKQTTSPVVWKQKKENLQQMLEQQKERLAEIQKQESMYGTNKKRKRQTDSPTPRDFEQDKLPTTTTASSKTIAQSVISCGKCIKLEADLRLISQQYIELKKENEQLKFELRQTQKK